MYSTPLLDAASNSIISGDVAKFIQFSHSSQGIPSFALGQFNALANNLAVLVLPVPLGPVKIYVCANLSLIIERFSFFFELLK